MDQKEIRYNCAVDATMRVIGGRWKPTIICKLATKGPMRFSELQKDIGEVTTRMLSKQLRELQQDGVVDRSVSDDGRRSVTYSITERGMSLGPVMKSMMDWGLDYEINKVIVPAFDDD